LLPGEGHNLLVAGAIISISLNPFIFRTMLNLEPKLKNWRWLALLIERRCVRCGEAANATAVRRDEERGTVRAIVVGYGPVGQTVTRLLREFQIDPTIIETNIDTVLQMQGQGRHAVFGDASRRDILAAAGLHRSTYLIVTVPKIDVALAVIQAARELAPGLRILARAPYLNHQEQLEEAGAAVIRYDEAESAAALGEALLHEIKVPPADVDAAVSVIRKELEPRQPTVLAS
jgi:CPA2 family monovalent cation:H+ antiporter-2